MIDINPITKTIDLISITLRPLDKNPAAVYLASLSESGRRKQQAMYNMLTKWREQAKVKNFSLHDLRRTFVSDLLEAGADIAIVSKMAGHANVQTTARYDRRPEEAKRKAARLMHVPYQRRSFEARATARTENDQA